MKFLGYIPLFALLTAVILVTGISYSLTAMQGRGSTGTIKGHVRLSGKNPGNVVIRMGVDPMCKTINEGKLVAQEKVLTSSDGGLKNAFVKLQGPFPQSPIPSKPVVLDQRGCVYVPRVVGIRVGQTLQIRNDDPLQHNVHSNSAHDNSFNVGQATRGAVFEFRPKSEEFMLELGCDIHKWMRAYVGVVNHPYFAVSGDGGTFEIDNVPAGTQTIQVWHEAYGKLTKTVSVQSGAVANIEFTYTGAEKPSGN